MQLYSEGPSFLAAMRTFFKDLKSRTMRYNTIDFSKNLFSKVLRHAQGGFPFLSRNSWSDELRNKDEKTHDMLNIYPRCLISRYFRQTSMIIRFSSKQMYQFFVCRQYSPRVSVFLDEVKVWRYLEESKIRALLSKLSILIPKIFEQSWLFVIDCQSQVFLS